MQTQKPQKIDLTAEYPCPCGRRGQIAPITLTEAFGCNRCQQIFVVEESGYVLEQLSTNYPYKKIWHWTGCHWQRAHTGLREHYLPVVLAIVLGPPVVWLMLALRSASVSNIILWTFVAVLLMLLPAFMVWLAYRR
ncbi:hypothetical protein DO97_14400 [Neosynechococcus sphagnicola sy1]|uniref:Uncharacterized protein n=1 Tax=Neosynechococcus sphagnicola sy1 TaxID=1497020 RepID=A0A098TH73_9CYAN|nr:hypothetical protein [Neosynechococcus sphagnicola]KGF71935.1 hypothetical protein DO97_14400 [Neosynechococcus sphagnicola sy1]